MSKHTPGPWVTNAGKTNVWHPKIHTDHDSFGGPIAEVWSNLNFAASDPRMFEEMKANANLIAAAPKLLEALKNARAELEEIALSEGGDPYNNLEMNEAINKAEGKA